MFSSFKEKLNTSLTSIHEKGMEAAKAAKAASAGNSLSHRPSADTQRQHDLLQDPLSVGSAAGGRPGSPATASPGPRVSSSSLFRRSLQTGRQSADLISFATSPPPAAPNPTGNKKLMAKVKELTLDPLQEKPDPAQLEAVKAAEPGGIEMTDTVIEKLERLQRYEARFPGIQYFTLPNRGSLLLFFIRPLKTSKIHLTMICDGA
jgi:hypothetical protein